MIRLTRSQPVELLGEAPPRALVEPKGARANSWEDVADLSSRAGIVLDGWQEIILRAAMGERSDNTWAAKRVGVSVPRQNGKSQLLVARALAGVLLFGEKKIVISAHQADTARESFSKLVEILEADGNEWLMERVKPNGIMNAINRESVKFRNGATIQFKARTGSGGRGFSSDCLMLDEAQRLKRPAWVSINSTMSAMANPQVWLLGTPPTREDVEAQMGEVFASVRSSAPVSTATAWCEWGAKTSDPNFAEVMKPAPRAWTPELEALCWSANPAWNTRINHDVVQGEAESYTSEELAQDRMGVWLDDLGGGGTRAISDEAWRDTRVDDYPTDGVPSYAVAFSLDGSRLALGGGFKTETSIHLELIDAFRGTVSQVGLAPLADWFMEEVPAGGPRWKSAAAIVLSGSAGAAVLKQMLIERGVRARTIRVANTPEYLTACGMLDEGVKAKTVTHRNSEGQAALDASISITDKDKRGGWLSTVPDGDETPVEAISLALWGAKTFKQRSGAAVFR